ncbi:MerR family transcriptional regulator [Nocardia sp. NBC_01503]|uniref:MerR family transcriptional regulator n=1 Tax=Nocardia sp. NBC_01503 TaxID=2975997 RepID=UPI002E7BCFCE|nr:MerR family transcriptional regulator [Nocardia sp. NBC_01503]WTL29930.1 MerR family transcriptional regulator [Nocardia sp. NBC_01503]
MTGGPEYTIDELARAADSTVRSVRVYHERGVLPPPEVRGRTGYYGAEHLNRVRTISRLLDRGIKLNGIKELLAAFDRGDDLGDLLGVPDADQLSRDIGPGGATVAATELQNRFADVPNGLARVVTAGVFEPVDATNYRVADADLAGLLDRLEGAGVPITAALQEVERLKADCDRVARRVVDLVREHAWEPFANSERGPDDHAEFTARVGTLRSAPGRAAEDLLNRLIDRYLAQDAEIGAVLNPDS